MQRVSARKFEDLEVWQYAHRFVLEVYRVTSAFPKTETYGLAAQVRRAAMSVPANIAEGFKKRSWAVVRGLPASPATQTTKGDRLRHIPQN
jgi:hypothetical protein